jgi:hypothetical protein
MVVLSSDRVRKEQAGLNPETPAGADYQAGIYSPEHTRATYHLMLQRAELLMGRGESVVLDASWVDVAERERAAAVADRTHAELVPLRCELDPATAAERIRRRTGISDADERIATRLRQATAPWPGSTTIDTGRTPEECASRACARIRPGPGPETLLRRRPRMAPD